MNCISSSIERYNPRILESQDNDDESIQEFYRANPCTLEKNKARQMESVLENAITMAENSKGSLFCLQHMSKMNAIELGRHISTCQAMKKHEETKGDQDVAHDEIATLTPSCSFQSALCSPTFVKVEQEYPAILTQKSMETISLADTESEEGEIGMQSNNKAAPVVTPPRRRTWTKLRKTLSKEERTAKELQRQQTKRGTERLNSMSLTKSDGGQNLAKYSAVEVSLISEKKKGWGSPLRRSKKKKPTESKKARVGGSRNSVQDILPLTPTLIPMEISQVSEEEDIFLNDRSPINDVSMEVEEESLYDEEPVVLEESMEVVNQGSCFDIIGASNLLNGHETSWKDLTEDNFDVIPRIK